MVTQHAVNVPSKDIVGSSPAPGATFQCLYVGILSWLLTKIPRVRFVPLEQIYRFASGFLMVGSTPRKRVAAGSIPVTGSRTSLI